MRISPKDLLLMIMGSLFLCVGADAQNATITDSQLANQLNPEGSSLNLWPWTEFGLNPFAPYGSRSPTGLLYPEPQERAELKPHGENGWQSSSLLEVGVLGNSGTTNTASFLQYGDWSPGVIAGGHFQLSKPSQSRYITGIAGSIGRDDQYYRLSFGTVRGYDLTATYRSIPHVLSTNARVLWDGLGSGNLTLPSSVTPGVADTIRQALLSTNDSVLQVNREKTDLSFSIYTNRATRLFARASTEERNGARPFGGTFAYPFLGQVAETVQPIDYRTNELLAGLNYAGTSYQFNVLYSGSLFTNSNTSLRWENPGLTPFAVPFVPPVGQMALAPDNSYNNLRADLAGPLPFWQGRFSTSLSWSIMRQDEDLVAPTISTGQIQAGNSVIDLDQWNSVAALSRTSANAEREYLLGQLKLILRPSRKLRLTAKLRVRDEDNKTSYTAQNPQTGQLGYIALDGGLAAAFPTSSAVYDPALPGSRVRYRSIPFEKDTLLAQVAADLRISPRTRISLGIDREQSDYANRERDEVVDDRYRASIVRRGDGWGTVRISYEFTDRHGDDYEFNPYEPFYTSSLADFTPLLAEGSPPHTLSAMRKLDLASHTQHTLDIQSSVIVGRKTDLSLSAHVSKRDLAAEYGLRITEKTAINVQWGHRFNRSNTLTAFYSYQGHNRDIGNIADALRVGTDPNPGGIVYPFENAWAEFIDERNNLFGANFSYANQKLSFDLRYTYLRSRSQLDYSFASDAAFFGLYPAEEAGNGFPEQRFDNQILETNLRFRPRDDLVLSFFMRWESEDLEDFHYTGLTDPVIADSVFLGAAPENFSALVFGTNLKLAF
jgi:MtrB/PioB family decaheme-associated outer membrane protein